LTATASLAKLVEEGGVERTPGANQRSSRLNELPKTAINNPASASPFT
jgi:hypothetical protein